MSKQQLQQQSHALSVQRIQAAMNAGQAKKFMTATEQAATSTAEDRQFAREELRLANSKLREVEEALDQCRYDLSILEVLEMEPKIQADYGEVQRLLAKRTGIAARIASHVEEMAAELRELDPIDESLLKLEARCENRQDGQWRGAVAIGGTTLRPADLVANLKLAMTWAFRGTSCKYLARTGAIRIPEDTKDFRSSAARTAEGLLRKFRSEVDLIAELKQAQKKEIA